MIRVYKKPKRNAPRRVKAVRWKRASVPFIREAPSV